jgi:hypothetical protein
MIIFLADSSGVGREDVAWRHGISNGGEQEIWLVRVIFNLLTGQLVLRFIYYARVNL